MKEEINLLYVIIKKRIEELKSNLEKTEAEAEKISINEYKVAIKDLIKNIKKKDEDKFNKNTLKNYNYLKKFIN